MRIQVRQDNTCPVKIRQRQGVTIFDLETLERTTSSHLALRAVIEEQIDVAASGQCNILFNLQQVKMIYSSVIGLIIYAYTSALKQRGRIALLHANDKIATLFRDLKLHALFDWYDDEEAAIASFQSVSGA